MPGDRRALDWITAHQQVKADVAYLQGVWMRLAKTTLIIEGARLAFSDSVQVLNRDGEATSFANSNIESWTPESGLSPDGSHAGPSGET